MHKLGGCFQPVFESVCERVYLLTFDPYVLGDFISYLRNLHTQYVVSWSPLMNFDNQKTVVTQKKN